MPYPEHQRWKNIMKAYPFEEKRLAKWHPPYIVQPKYDGVRCRAVPLDQGGYLLLSSEENIIYSVPHLNIILRNSGMRAELDGELYCHGMSFEEIVSITSRTVNIHPDHTKIKFHVFDIINSDLQMKRQLIIEDLRGASSWLVVAPFWICESLDDVLHAYDKLIELKYEGIIVRNVQAPYERKRSIWVMKFKPKKEDSYEITGFNEEISIEGVSKGTLGSLVCLSGDGGSFSVGSGFTQDQRYELWKVRDSLVGKSVRIKYQHVTSGKKVPRFPIFVEII